ncbi:MAG: ATP-binding cassette domain-containing protein [Treponema sp.]|nr:ATP-binding cassette domain-containing protein [Treponema sp.]
MNQISVHNVKFRYPQSAVYAVNDVSFEIEKGAYIAIVGYNGSGKSSLARLLCGLDEPESGSIEIAPNNRIGIIFQSPKEQLVSGLVQRDTAFGPQNLLLSPAEVELRTIEALNIVDMLDRADSSTSALSLGQTQKIALSGVIALSPEIYILDEAVSMLDPQSRKDILDFIRYRHKCGNTIIQITHDIDVIQEADTVIGMDKGKITFYGTRSAFMADEKLVSWIQGPVLEKKDKSTVDFSGKKISFSLKNLSFKYEKNVQSKGVENISFDLYEGSITALTGPSGAGKSTILELCSGLLEGEGEIKSCSGRPAYAQQNAKAALFENFAADDVAFGPENLGLTGKDLVERVRNSMDMAALPFDEFGERRTFALSGGEQRRLSIAGILALGTDVILFDEPTAGIDGKRRYEVLMMMRNLAAQGKTILFSTHHPDEAEFADREIKIENGKIISDSYKANDNLKELSDSSNEASAVSPYASALMLKGLRSLSAGLSGHKKSQLSLIEKLPPAFRMIVFALFFVFSLAARPWYITAIALALSLVYCKISGFSFRRLIPAILKIMPFLLFFSIFQLIFHPALPDEVRFTKWKWFMITPSKLLFCLESILRTLGALSCISAFFVSTPEYDLIDGLKKLLRPLELIKVPVRYFILIVEIIFRFIPLLVDEAGSILKTQLIRGGLGQKKGRLQRIRAVIPLIVPLIIQTIKRSESLADAITMRYFK